MLLAVWRSFTAIVFLACLVNSASIPSTEQNLFPVGIVHINDFHSKFEQTNWQSTACKEKLGQVCIGGYARTLTAVKTLLKEKADKNPIYLNIGDNFVGTLWYELLGWNVTSIFLNLLSADATTLGNHEFDRGIDGVVPFMETLKSPIVVANIDDSQEPTFQGKYKKSIIIERSGRKIGLIGAIAVATKEISSPGNLIFLDEVKSVKKEADRLQAEENVDIIIVLSHCGLDVDREMAMYGGNIDVIVGGHSHDLLYTGTPVPGPDTPKDKYPAIITQPNGHKVLIVQASAYTKFVGNLTVYFDDAGDVQKWDGNPIFLDDAVEEDPDIKARMAPFKEEIDKIALREIGSLATTLYDTECEYDECTFGDFITDTFVDYYANCDNCGREDDAWTAASIAIIHSGAIRNSINPGPLNYDDIFTALPFQYTIDLLELSGSELKELMEYSAVQYKTYNFIQISGMNVVYNVSNAPGNRVTSIEVLCRKCSEPKFEPLIETSIYRMAVPSFIADGGNGFDVFKKRRNFKRSDKKDIDIIADYLAKHSPASKIADGRIKVLS